MLFANYWDSVFHCQFLTLVCVCGHVSRGRVLCPHEKLLCFVFCRFDPERFNEESAMKNLSLLGFSGSQECPELRWAKGSRSLRISVVEKRGVCFSPFLLLLRQSVQAGSCSLADLYHGKVFVLFCLLPQVCLYGGYSSAQHPSKETIPAPSERTSHGDQIWAGNHTEGGSLDYGVQEKLRTSKTRVWKCQ